MDPILYFIVTTIKILQYAILARVLLSWVNVDKSARWYQILYSVTEPSLKVLRNILPRTGMIDLSPILAFFILGFIESGIIRLFAGF